jgi:pilus assembly protein FimV
MVMRFKTKFFGVALALCSVASCALTLGPVQGTPLIGRQLNLSVTVQTQSESSAGTLCPQVEVLYADKQVDPRQVKVTTEPTDRSDWVTLRILSESPVNEPVVTLQLRAGCESEVSRRYVLLPDVPSEFSLPTEVLAQLPQVSEDGNQSRSLPPAPRASASTSALSTRIQSDSSQGKPTSQGLDKPSSTRSNAAKSLNRAPAAAKVAPKSPEAGAGRSRLTLDPLEILVERVRTLESATQPEQLEELARTSQNVLRLQADIKTLLDQATINASNMGALQERLKKAEETRVADALVYLMAAVALVCAVGIVVFWRRSENLMRALAEKPSTPFTEIAQHRQLAPEPQPQAQAHAHAHAQPHPHADATPPAAPKALLVNEDWLEIDEKGLRDFIHPLPTEPAPLEAIPDTSPLPHAPEPGPSTLDFHSNDVLALIDQARLLVQLGKIDEATNVLESRIRKKETDSPLVFLEILRIANVCNRKTEFRRFSEEFQRVFNVTVPEFALFRAEGRSLDAYPGLQRHIEKLWPNPEVLEVIESCIVRSAWGNNSEPFDLAAFKELVQLHGLALNASLSPEDSAMQEFPKQNFDSTMIDFEV